MTKTKAWKEIQEALPKAPEYLIDQLIRFENLIAPYFPELENDHYAAGFEMEWLWTSYQHSSIEIVPKPLAIKELYKLEHSLNFLIDIDLSYYLTLATQENKNTRYFLDFLSEINNSVNTPDDCMGKKKVSDFIEHCKKTIESLPDKGNKNWDGLLAVESLRVLWWRNSGRSKEAPRYLNPATTFAEYLRDGFKFLEIEGDVVSAFRSWRVHFPHNN